MKLYLYTVDKTWFDATGSLLPDGQPNIPYKNTERVEIQLVKTAPNQGSPGVDPATDWEKDTQYAIAGIGARLSADNNFLQYKKGAVKTAITAGSIASIELTISGATAGTIPHTGSVRLWDAAGDYESVSYTARTISGTIVTFTAASGSTVTKNYAAGDTADCPEPLYMTAVMNGSLSDASTGKFVFDITAFSEKLRESVEYQDSKEVGDVKGLELLIYRVDGSTTQVLNSYICKTFAIPRTMALVNSNAQIPSSETDNVIAIVDALLTLGFSIELYNSTSGQWETYASQTITSAYTKYRFWATCAGSGATKAEVPLIHGADGEDGEGNAWASGNADPVDTTGKMTGDLYLCTGTDNKGNVYQVTETGGVKSWTLIVNIHGPQGQQGPTGTLTEATAWVSSTAYSRLAVVTYLGECYQCIGSSVPAGTLPTDTTNFIKLSAKGGQGQQGPTGTLTEATAWDASIAYSRLAIVTYLGETYQCIASDVPSGTLPTDTTKFIKLAAKGADGAAGQDGQDGQDGADGEDGAAAGFGTPTATATALASSATPTVQITASGPDTAKVFALAFGIPAGQFENGVQPFSFTSSDLTNNVLVKTFAQLGIYGTNPIPVQIVDNGGVVRDADSQVSVTWTATGISVDLSQISGGITGTWKLIFGGGSDASIVGNINSILDNINGEVL